MARKENAKQRRERKERERKQAELYRKGYIEPAIGKGRHGKKRALERVQSAQREMHTLLSRSPNEANALNTAQMREELYALHDIAYQKYSALISQGTPNAATVQYESEFDYIPIATMTLNEMRGVAAKLRHWLKRKDLYLKRQKRYQEAQVKRLQKLGIEATLDDLPDYYDFVSKARQLGMNPNWKNAQGSPPVSVKIAYARYRSGEISLADALQEAVEGMRREYEHSITANTFGFNPLESGLSVQSAQPSKLLATYKAALRMPTVRQLTPTNRAQRRSTKKKKKRR